MVSEPILEEFALLIKWRDESDTKRKARAIQRIIDKKVEKFTDVNKSWLESRCRAYGLKLSDW